MNGLRQRFRGRGLMLILTIAWIAGAGVADCSVPDTTYLKVNGRDGGAATNLEIGQGSEIFTVTMEAWVFPESVSPGRHPVLSSDNGGYDWSVLREGDSWHVFTGSRSEDTGFTVDQHTWQHIAAVFSDGHVVFYKNGQESASMSLAYDKSTKPLAIGRSSGRAEFFDGRITEVRIWGRALTAAEIRAGMHHRLEGQMENLIGYWRCDEGHGTVAHDLSGHEHDARLTGGAGLISDKSEPVLAGRSPATKDPVVGVQPEPQDDVARLLVALLDGDGERAAEIFLEAQARHVPELVARAGTERPTQTFVILDGVNDLISTDLKVDQASAGSALTMEAWVYPTRTLHARSHLVTTDNGGYDWSLLQEKGRWHVYTNRRSADTGVSVDINRWQHVAVVFAGGVVTFYKDGRPSEVGAVAFDTDSAALTIGGNTTYGQYLAGRIDEVRVWNRALTASEIQANMARELTGDQQGLIGYWRCNGQHDGRVPDLSGHGHHGTLQRDARIGSE